MAWAPGLPANNTKLRLSPAIFQANNASLQTVVSASNLDAEVAYLPNTAPVYMYTNVAPTGWTLVSTPSDCLLALKGGSSQYNVDGGTLAGTWTGPGYELLFFNIPQRTGSPGSVFGYMAAQTSNIAAEAHSHDWTTTRPMAAVGIMCSKNA